MLILELGGSAFPGNYANNFFIESANGAIVLNTNGRTSTSTPNLLIRYRWTYCRHLVIL